MNGASPTTRIEELRLLARLRIGHSNLTQADPPECDRCRQPTTVKHILLECRKFTTIGNKYYNNPTLMDLLGNIDNHAVTKLIAYLQESGIFTKI